MIRLEITKRNEDRLLERMTVHYSQPKGFVGRNICYAIYYNDDYYGHIVGGSATRFLPGRNEFLDITIKELNSVVNNIFYNVSKVNDKYPTRNFTTKVLNEFCKQVAIDWKEKYNDEVVGFETLIEKPRTGELYLKAGWIKTGETVGYTCKRVSGWEPGKGWSGQRVWNTDKESLRPKIVLCKRR